MNQLQEPSTDIIIVSNKFCDIATKIDRKFTRGCNLINVTKLTPINSVQRMVYGLLKKRSYIPSDGDRNAFIYFSESSKDTTTIVHMLTSLLQNAKSTKELYNSMCKPVQNEESVSKVDKTSPYSVVTSDDKILYMCINNILRSGDFSLPAQHLLHCLSILGSIPLLKIYVDELGGLIMKAITDDNQQESLVNQLQQGGVIRKFPNPILYHKNLNPQNVDLAQLLFIPELICDASKHVMNGTDKQEYMKLAQHALWNILSSVQVDRIRFHYIYVLYDRLHEICIKQNMDGLECIIENFKLKFKMAEYYQKGIT